MHRRGEGGDCCCCCFRENRRQYIGSLEYVLSSCVLPVTGRGGLPVRVKLELSRVSGEGSRRERERPIAVDVVSSPRHSSFKRRDPSSKILFPLRGFHPRRLNLPLQSYENRRTVVVPRRAVARVTRALRRCFGNAVRSPSKNSKSKAAKLLLGFWH